MKFQKMRISAGIRQSAAALGCLALLFAAGCGMDAEEEGPRGLNLEEDTEVRLQQLSSFCTVQLEEYGAVDVEEDYLPSVIACENGNAPMEALKAQAIAARTYALFITEAEQRPLATTEDDQVYNCDYAEPEARHYEAVQATAGQVLTHGDRLLATFYVAGAVPSAASCVAAGGDPDATNTERFVTYNQGRIGNEIRRSPLGHMANPANRGAKSQNGAACLADKGWDYERILRFYYGDDAVAEVAEGSTCAAGGAATGGGGGDVCQLSAASSSEPGCVNPSTMPDIRPRSEWGGRPARYNQRAHNPERIAVHHTVTPNGAADGAHWVRQVQKWHMDDNGWPDIGYHFLIAWDGTIYRGAAEERLGTHSRSYNSNNLGISVIGRYDTGEPSEAQLASLTQMLRYLSDKYDIDLNRDLVKGHQEQPGQSTACPGTNLLNQLDDIVGRARGEASCSGGETPTDEADETGGDVSGYRYVRVSGVSNEPTVSNDIIDGFEVDSIYAERHNGATSIIQAGSVLCSPGVSNASGALGAPDNDSCENRPSTVAGVSAGGDLVVEMSEPIKSGDILYVTQHRYFAANANCAPSGTAKVSVSNDGRVWKVLDTSVSGNWQLTLDEDSFVIDEDDETSEAGDGFEVISPKPGNWYRADVAFSALAGHPDIVEVSYEADNWEMGRSSNRGDNFRMNYEFQYFGERNILVQAFDSNGEVVASKEFTIMVTDFDGTIPEGSLVLPELPSAGVADSEMAETLAVEGGKCYDPRHGGPRCNNGTGGSSIGRCWGYVSQALSRAGHNIGPLRNLGACSAYRFGQSAYGFRCNADANPGVLRDQVGLERIDVPPTEAPRGAVITWHKGCVGFHAQHGHIEIAQGDGTACSDYCGNIRSGGQSCSSVYVPVSN